MQCFGQMHGGFIDQLEAGRMNRRLFPSLLVAVLSLTLIAACSAKDQGAELKANPWAVTSYITSTGQALTLQGTSPAMYFRNDRSVIGNASVNAFRGPYSLQAHNIRVGPLTASAWRGPQMAMTQDAQILAAMASAARYSIHNGTLQISDGSKKLLMNLEAAKAPVLVGPAWACTSYAGKGGSVEITGTVPVVAQFAPDGTLTGSGGVNTYSGTYTVSGEKMTVGAGIVSTKMAGPEPLMTQEADYLAAIAKTASFKIEDFELTLFDASGNPVAVYLPLAPKN
jgi:heat shock protein HslJ